MYLQYYIHADVPYARYSTTFSPEEEEQKAEEAEEEEVEEEEKEKEEGE